MNIYSFTGNITRDIELKQTPNGKNYTHLDVAINDGFGDNKTTFYIRVVVWGKQAENCVKYLSKGDTIGCSGKLLVRTFELKNGEKKTAIEVESNEIDFIKTKGKDQAQEKSSGLSAQLEEIDEDLPF